MTVDEFTRMFETIGLEDPLQVRSAAEGSTLADIDEAPFDLDHLTPAKE